MSRINTNIGALRGLRNLGKANKLLDTSLTRLSTGLQINSGKDNPSGLIASESLRLQVTSIEQSIKNSNRANNVIATADGALGEISGLLSQVRGLVQEGLNDGALSQSEIEANQLQIDAALSAINRISSNTTFAGDKLIDGSKAFNTAASATDAAKLSDFKINEALFGSNSQIGVSATVNSAAEKGELRYNGGQLSQATTLEISGSKGQQVLFLGGSSTVANIRDAINNVTDTTGVTARVDSGLSINNAAVANSLDTGVIGNNNALTFTDARATSDLGANASLGGSVSVEIVDAAVAEATVAVATDADGNSTITVTTDITGGNNATADDIRTAIQQNAEASALVSVENTGASDGSGNVVAVGPTALTGGTDAGSINFTDARTAGASGNVSVVFTDPAANSSALALTVTQDGTTGDAVINVSLETDASGNLISSLDDIAAAIQADSVASTLVNTAVSGDGTSVAAAQASTDLTEATGSLVLESANFGSAEFVEVNVLSGSFTTLGADNATATNRDAGQDIGVIINGQQADGKGLEANIRTSTLDASLTFNAANNTAGETANMTITGGGSVFQIGEDVSPAGQIGIGLEAVNTARLGGISGKLFELGTGNGKSLLDVRDGSATGSDLVGIIEEALDRVSTLRGRLGAVQKNVIETNISTLGVALENISEARSQILDTDFAAETAALTKAQILNQSGISVLSIANQAPQSVLSLLG